MQLIWFIRFLLMVTSPIQRTLCQQPPKMANLKKKVERSVLKAAMETVKTTGSLCTRYQTDWRKMHLVHGKGKSTGSDSY